MSIKLNTLSAYNLTDVSVTSGGDIISGANIAERGVVYGTYTYPTTINDNKIVASGTTTGVYTVDIPGTSGNPPLLPDTVYYIRAYAIDNEDKVYYGNQVTILTLTFITIPPYNITQTTFISGGRYIDTSLTITGKGICWDTLPNPTLRSPHSTITTTDKSDYVLHANGCKANTKYYVRAYILIDGDPTYALEYSFFTGISNADPATCTYTDITVPTNETYIVPPGYELVSINYNGNAPETLTGCTDMSGTTSCINC